MTRCPAFRRSGNFCPWKDDENAGVPRAPIMTSGPTTRLRELVKAPGNDAPDCIAQLATTPRGRSRAALDPAIASATAIATVKHLTMAERYTGPMAAVPPRRVASVLSLGSANEGVRA